jgi:hypothetical protein
MPALQHTPSAQGAEHGAGGTPGLPRDDHDRDHDDDDDHDDGVFGQSRARAFFQSPMKRRRSVLFGPAALAPAQGSAHHAAEAVHGIRQNGESVWGIILAPSASMPHLVVPQPHSPAAALGTNHLDTGPPNLLRALRTPQSTLVVSPFLIFAQRYLFSQILFSIRLYAHHRPSRQT